MVRTCIYKTSSLLELANIDFTSATKEYQICTQKFIGKVPVAEVPVVDEPEPPTELVEDEHVIEHTVHTPLTKSSARSKN